MNRQRNRACGRINGVSCVDSYGLNFHHGWLFEGTLRVANALVDFMVVRLSGLTHERVRS
jgi:hypothetical protein